RLRIDVETSQYLGHRRERTGAGAGELAQCEPLRLPLPESALVLGCELAEERGSEARGARRGLEREQAAGGIALVRHARRAAPALERRLGSLADLGLGEQRDVAGDFRSESGQDRGFGSEPSEAVAGAVPGDHGIQTKLLAQPPRDFARL